MADPKKTRSSLKANITKLKTSVDGFNPDTVTVNQVKLQMEKWEKYAGRLDTNHDDLIQASKDQAEEAAEQADFEVEDQRLDELKLTLQDLMKAANLRENPQPNPQQPPAGPAPQVQAQGVALRKLDLPKFSGEYEDWPTFMDMFVAMVHSKNNYSDHEKLWYLKQALEENVPAVLSATAITDANYAGAWQAVNERFNHPRLLISAQINKVHHLPHMKNECPKELRSLLDTLAAALRALKALKLETKEWDPLLVCLVIERLDVETRRQWEQSLTTKDMPSFDELEKFLTRRCEAMESLVSAPIKQKNTSFGNSHYKKEKTSAYHAATSGSCVLCKEDHPLSRCKMFTSTAVPGRVSLVKKHQLCFNCLRAGHSAAKCQSGTCRKCNMKHHTLLHLEKNETTGPENRGESSSVNLLYTKYSKIPKTVLLSTACVKAVDKHGDTICARALVDNCSEGTFITENLVQKLGLKREKLSVDVSGLGGNNTGNSKWLVTVTIRPHFKDDYEITVKAFVMRHLSLTGKLPKTPLQLKKDSVFKNMKLADPAFGVPADTDLLLGAEIFSEILNGAVLRGGETETLTAYDTRLGWLLTGKGERVPTPSIRVMHVSLSADEQLKKFWELEEVHSLKSQLTEDEEMCEDIFAATTTRMESGRYSVALPFRCDRPTFGSTYKIAQKRMLSLETRLARNEEVRDRYCQFMKEYELLDHMEQVPATEIPPAEVYYLPHHEVIKESSSTTKLRVVFNASQKDDKGHSLNSHMLVGPKIQEDLYQILARFRTHNIAMAADIEKMFRQIQVRAEDRDFQRILWQPNPRQSIQPYRLTTVTHGTACAPYLAQKTLQKLAQDEAHAFPEASKIVLRDFYMDNVMTGARTEEEALKFQHGLINLLNTGGFPLRKWSSNSVTVLESIPEDMREAKLPLSIEENESVKTLGMQWNSAQDTFSYKVELPAHPGAFTKRSVLSDTARIFDPLGLLAPVTVRCKMFLQKLWLQGLGWDESLPADCGQEDQEDLATIWSQIREQLECVKFLKIPRRISELDHPHRLELHCFSDSSEQAYAAAVYLRSESASLVSARLISAKTRVAPLKQVSLPKLELCGAVLLVWLLKALNCLNLHVDAVHAWTDSTLVLAWINGAPRKWKTFVANRVAEIQDVIPPAQWHHVKGIENPADIPSRGMSPMDLLSSKMWWEGPDWLRQAEVQYPNGFPMADKSQLTAETKPVKVFVSALNEEQPFILGEYSSLAKILRITALVLRFTRNIRPKKSTRQGGPLTLMELDGALKHWVKFVQAQAFKEELKILQLNQESADKKHLPSRSPLLKLTPILDNEGLIRVGGRLSAAQIPFDQKFPMVLPKNGPLTAAIIQDAHLKYFHAGPQLMMATITQKFWILSARDAVRRAYHRCVVCFRQKCNGTTQLMGNLPAVRVQPSRTFYNTGLDYAGPIKMKAKRGRGKWAECKGYIAVFVCMATKAVHLECVSDLSTECFLAAYRRFVSRRGVPRIIHSDNGTNFVGANNELKSLLKQLVDSVSNDHLAKKLLEHGTEWRFIPPGAPHMGGLWEAGVKSMKTHLYKTLGRETFTFEEMQTVLYQIEACLNSRPLCPLSSDPSDLQVLTPGHFLIGEPITSVPELDLTEENYGRLSRWQQLQHLHQGFWKRWRMEYLSQLNQRPKWFQPKKNLQVNDMVIVTDERVGPCRWPLGRIVDVKTGNDGFVRSATVRTASGVLQRPVTKLSPLPIEDNGKEDTAGAQEKVTEEEKIGAEKSSLFFVNFNPEFVSKTSIFVF